MYLKKIDRGSANFFGSEIFYILIFLGLEHLFYFSGLKMVPIFFGATILIQFIFGGVRLNDLDLQNHSNNKINE